MSVKHIQDQLDDIYRLLDMSEKILDDINSINLARLEETLMFIKKNIRDARKLTATTRAELSEIVREIDEHEIDIDEEVF